LGPRSPARKRSVTYRRDIGSGGHSITSAPRATRHHRRRQSRRRLIGANGVAHSPPDGYSSLLGSTSTQVLLTPVMANPPYDPVKDFSTLAGLHAQRKQARARADRGELRHSDTV
jgi:hypothetical protein